VAELADEVEGVSHRDRDAEAVEPLIELGHDDSAGSIRSVSAGIVRRLGDSVGQVWLSLAMQPGRVDQVAIPASGDGVATPASSAGGEAASAGPYSDNQMSRALGPAHRQWQ
jgi:hypothetical protein